MKNFLLAIMLIGLLSSPASLVFAKTTNTTPSEQEEGSYFDLPLCLPGMPADGTCQFLGPAQVVAELKEAGFPYPMRDLPAAKPSPELGVMPVLIAKINLPEDQPAPYYATFDDAVKRSNPIGQIDAGGLRYVSYVSRLDHNDKAYVQMGTGGWMPASPAGYTKYQGLTFFENPQNDFGWILYRTDSYLEPSFNARPTGNIYFNEEVIQVFDSVEAEGVTWYKIGPDEWVNSQYARVASPNPTPPEGVATGRWIEIDLHQQTLLVYEEGQLLFATLVATGRDPFFTKPGVFKIYEKKPLETMRGAFEADRSDFYYLQDVPWTMYYDEARALHSTYWPFGFGNPQSHGCINLSPGDAQWLFQWAEEGDYVWVHDPSGETPLDPDYYGPGAP